MTEEEDYPKENPPTLPDLGGAKNAAPKKKPPSSFLIFFAFGLCGDTQFRQWGVKHEPTLGSVPGYGLCSIVSVSLFYLIWSNGGSVSISPLLYISFETLCFVFIFSLY